MKPKAIICDLDGTLCNTSHRQHFVENGKKDFYSFFKAIPGDSPNVWCVNLIKLYFDAGYSILFVSGRPNDFRDETVQWLKKHLKIGFEHYMVGLFMRPSGNYTKDSIVKENIYNAVIKPYYDVEAVIDDRNSVVKMWRELGLTCLQCQEGDF